MDILKLKITVIVQKSNTYEGIYYSSLNITHSVIVYLLLPDHLIVHSKFCKFCNVGNQKERDT